MKKIIPLFVLILLLSGCSLIVKEKPFNIITAEEIQKKLDSKDNFILVVGNKEKCGTCESYLRGGLRGLEEKNDYKVDYIMIDTLEKQAEINKLSEILYKQLGETDTMLGVPTTYIISNGEVSERLKGPILYDEISKKYEKYVK